ncbi:MAG: glycogen debranching enzyme [Chlamydiia bacterium]|nr:glycogen debranching enzyme [Chlamydiia bacterium]
MFVPFGKNLSLGVDFQGDSAQFTLFSHHAERVFLGLFNQQGHLLKKIAMKKSEGDLWQVQVAPLPEESYCYAYQVLGPKGVGLCFSEEWLADPYARALHSSPVWGSPVDRDLAVRALLQKPEAFDWEGASPPRIARSDLVIYEMHVRGFSCHESSGVSLPGSFQAIVEKIPYLKQLGVNAIELMPIFEFDEMHGKPEPLCNYWGYSPLHFFAPMRRYAGGEDPSIAFKTLVRELHKNGIEIYLDVVYNHTGEGKESDYKIHLRGIDAPVYYMLDEQGHLRDYAGCGNVLNVNHPVVQKWILDSLRYWVEEFHVDGFRFDLAAIFTRGTDGKPMAHPPLLSAIETDSVLKEVKWIAEVWDAAGLYLAGAFAARGDWMEWNGQYRDHVRRFIKGNDGEAGKFASCLCGSDFLFAPSKTPLSSINFISSHDGFTLRDLVSYNQKHNRANGEGNRDGTDINDSWNCGIEGPTEAPAICALREQQMRNFLLALFLSQGIPMLSMRDEYGHSCQGNNNPYAQDNEINWFVWNERADIVQFVAKLIAFRKTHPVLRRERFLTDTDIAWHGHRPHQPDFGPHSHFIACTVQGTPPIYIAFNADRHSAQVELPEGNWKSVVQTEKAWDDQEPLLLSHQLELPPHSALLAIGESS